MAVAAFAVLAIALAWLRLPVGTSAPPPHEQDEAGVRAPLVAPEVARSQRDPIVAVDDAGVPLCLAVADHLGHPCSGAVIGWRAEGQSYWRACDERGELRVSPRPEQFVVHVVGQSALLRYEFAALPRDAGRAVVRLPAPEFTGRFAADPTTLVLATPRICGAWLSYTGWPPELETLCLGRYGATPDFAIQAGADGAFAMVGLAPGRATLRVDPPFRFRASGQAELAVQVPTLGAEIAIDAPVLVTGTAVTGPRSELFGARLSLVCMYAGAVISARDEAPIRADEPFVVPLSQLVPSDDPTLIELHLEVRHADYGVLLSKVVSTKRVPRVDVGLLLLEAIPTSRLRLIDAQTRRPIAGGSAHCGRSARVDADPAGYVELRCAAGSTVDVHAPGYDVLSVLVDRVPASRDVALHPATSLDVEFDGLASRTGLALKVTVAAAHRMAVARHVRGAPPDDESMIDGMSGNGHEETLSVPLHDGEPVRLRAFAVRPETATDTRFSVRLTLVDGYGNRIAEQEVQLDYGARQVGRLQVSGTGGTFRGRIIDGQGKPIAGAAASCFIALLRDRRTTTDPQGEFAFEQFWGDRSRISVSAPGHTLVEGYTDASGRAVYVLAPVKTLAVETLDAAGVRVNAEVSAVVASGTVWQAEQVSVGVARFGDLPAVPLRVTARHGQLEVVRVVDGPERQVTLTIR